MPVAAFASRSLKRDEAQGDATFTRVSRSTFKADIRATEMHNLSMKLADPQYCRLTSQDDNAGLEALASTSQLSLQPSNFLRLLSSPDILPASCGFHICTPAHKTMICRYTMILPHVYCSRPWNRPQATNAAGNAASKTGVTGRAV